MIKTTNFLLDEVNECKLHKLLVSNVDVNNCLVFYYLSNVFNNSDSSEVSAGLIERCFPMVAETNNFQELDFITLKKILSSSGLNIDSELQVFNAVDSWLCHDITRRRKYGKQLFSKVRLSLLSAAALKQMLNKKQYLCEFFKTSSLRGFLFNKQQLNLAKSNNKIRYCTQNKFDIVVCGGCTEHSHITNGPILRDVKCFKAKNFSKVKNLQPMRQARIVFDSICIKGEVFVIGGNDGETMSIEKYSPASNTWEYVAEVPDDRECFTACSFMDSIYIVGGYVRHSTTNTCVEFNTKTLQWKVISNMNEVRTRLACSVFEGRVVVSGGLRGSIFINDLLNTVEAYDHVANTWFKLPNMIKARYYHKSIAIKNKLFIVGQDVTKTCEVLNSNTNKFCLLNTPKKHFKSSCYYPTEVISIGSKLNIFYDKGHVIIYDIDNDEWSEKTCEATKNMIYFSGVKLPVKIFKEDFLIKLKGKEKKQYNFFEYIFNFISLAFNNE